MTDASSDMPSDLLTGVEAIAKHLRWTARQVKHRVDIGELPTFRIGRSICARRLTLAQHFAEQERQAASPPPVAPPPRATPPDGDMPPMVVGNSAIAARLGVRPRELTHLDRQRLVPTYREGGRLVASAAALDDYVNRKGEI